MRIEKLSLNLFKIILMKIKHIYWFANFNPFSPSVRYRGIYTLMYLKEHYGIKNSFIYPSYQIKMIVFFIITLVEILLFRKRDSIIVIENVYTKRIYATILKFLIKMQPKRTLYDIDDAEYERFSPENINFFMKNCSACSVGSRTLMEYAQTFNANTFLLTSPVIEHNIVKSRKNELFTIGWVGFFTAHKKSLYDKFFPALTQLNISIRLILMGIKEHQDEVELREYFKNHPNIIIEVPNDIDWSDEIKIYQKISQFDIGITTLMDNELNRAKSAFKLKQYMSCGVPVLGSHIGENKYFLTDGFNGFFCNTPEEFKDKIVTIKNMPFNDYINLCQNARKTYQQFDMKSHCERLITYYEENSTDV